MTTVTKRRGRPRKTTAKTQPETRNFKAPEISIAVPTWNNANILWLALEGLLRQKTDHAFEVIVSECPKDKEYVSEKTIREYADKFSDRGCALVYLRNKEKMSLANKWIQMAKTARSPYLIMLGSDDYAPSEMVETYVDLFREGVEWVDNRETAFYDLKTRRMGWFRAPEGKTSCEFATLSERVASMPETDLPRNIDGYILAHVKPRAMHGVIFTDGVHTDGANSISHHRAAMYACDNPRRPFVHTVIRLRDRVPADIADRLEKSKIAEVVS
jgi:glycosyltransferase involved in cell wall biosynthesis